MNDNKPQRPIPTKKSHRWSEHEHQAMFSFVKTHRNQIITHMEDNIKSDTKTYRKAFYVDMAQFILSKTEKQCKSRFQKYELKMLQAIDVPSKLIVSYMTKQKLKNRKSIDFSKSKNIVENNKTTTYIETKCMESPIRNYEELKDAINSNYIPCIKNKFIKDQLVSFVSKLSDHENELKDLSCVYAANAIKKKESDISMLDIKRDEFISIAYW